MIFDTSSFGDLSLVLIAFGAAFIAALWLALVIWTARDISRRTREVFTRILSVLVVLVLFLPGLILYLILRPQSTLEDEYQRTLEEEALLQNIEDITSCPGCSRRIQKDWIVCPTCHTLLKKSCTNCGKLLDLPWNICPYCASSVSIPDNVNHATELDENTERDESMDASRFFTNDSEDEVPAEDNFPMKEEVDESDEGWVRISSIIRQKSEEKFTNPEEPSSENKG